MKNEQIALLVDEYVENNLQGVPFDDALPEFQEMLWNIAEQENKTGPDILKIYMDWKSKNK